MYSLLQPRGGAGRFLKLILAGLVLQVPFATAQFTQVMGTVIDPHGIPYANGTIFPNLIISGSPRFTSSGFPYVPPSQPTGLDAHGSFVMSIADVTGLTPSGAVWSFTVNCGTGCVPPAGGLGPVTFTTTGLIISGTVQDISSVLQLAAPPLTGGGGGGGGGSGTVAAGTVGQYAIYTGSTTVGSTPNLGESGGIIRASIPLAVSSDAAGPDLSVTDTTLGAALFQLSNGAGDTTLFSILSPPPFGLAGGITIAGTVSVPALVANLFSPPSQLTLTPVAGTNILAANSSGALVYSQNGAAFAPLSSPTNPLTLPAPQTAGAALTPLTGQGVGAFGVNFTGQSNISPASGVASIWALNTSGNAYSWQPVPFITINGVAPAGGVNSQNFGTTLPTASPTPTNGIDVVWRRALSNSGQNQTINASIIGDGIVTDCFVGTAQFIPCPSGGASTRTWSFAFQGVCQGGVASAPISIPPTNGPNYVACDATHITAEWQIPASSTTPTWFVKLRVPTGHTGAYTLTTTFRSAATTGSATLQPSIACVPAGAVPDNPTFSPSGITAITLTPSATTLQNVTTTGTFTPTCADGADLYVQYTFTANTVASPINFSYISLAVQGAL